MFPRTPQIDPAEDYFTPPDRRRSLRAICLPDSVAFYWYVMSTVIRSRLSVAFGTYDGDMWARSSRFFQIVLEDMGCRIEVVGLRHVAALDTPCVIAGNHMSSLETFFLPGLLQPLRDTTFVLKPSLLRMPLFGPVVTTRKPIVVTRDNPRRDLQIVLEEGTKRLQGGQSVIVFPQSTRGVEFDPRRFNSLAVKLARRAGAPLVPLALSSRAWGLGRVIKDFGPFDRNAPVRFHFAEPIEVKGSGSEAQERLVEHIRGHLESWDVPVRGDEPAGAEA